MANYCCCTPGAEQQQDQGWPDLSGQGLKQMSELQLNPLDNCAAACTCNSWRNAVKTAYVKTLHIHLDPSKSKQLMKGEFSAAKIWTSFLASRSKIGFLRLTASKDSLQSWLTSFQLTPTVAV